MSVPVVGGPPARVRIKGRLPSVMRFFTISVGFTMTWMMIQSELHYYAKWFGPQILLELNFAYYLPSIPVLLISGLVEGHLDKKYGPTRSMFLRLTVGLGGNAILAAAFPFIAGTHSGLLIIVAALGSLSAIAFSASYQLVQWFRHADIIGLGLGQVGCGPLVLLIQLGLEQFNAWPHRWQWIAMFELTAAMVLVALLAELSLFAQYWAVLTGSMSYEEVTAAMQAAEAAAEAEAEALASSSPRGSAEHSRDADSSLTAPLLLPSSVSAPPGQIPRVGHPPAISWGGSSTAAADAEEGHAGGAGAAGESPRSPRAMRRVSSGSAARRHTGHAHVWMPVELVPPEDTADAEQLAMTLAPVQGFFLNADPMSRGAFFRLRTHSSLPSSVDNSTPAAISRRARADRTATLLSASADTSASGATHGGLSTRRAAEHVADASAGAAGAADAAAAVADAATADVASKATVVVASPFADAPHAHAVAAAVEAAGTSAAAPADPFDFGGGGGDGNVQVAAPQAMPWAQETSATLSATWSVLVTFFVSVGTMYVVFPFFTYVPSSGIFGDQLSRTLFFTRIGCDICGRFSPRIKLLVARSPRVLATISALQVAVAALFIAYIKYMPVAYRSDWLPLGAVTFLWGSAGYMNTCCNIVAPSLVPDHLTGRCSGLMALAFKIAHFAGLVLCALLEVLLFSGGHPHSAR